MNTSPIDADPNPPSENKPPAVAVPPPTATAASSPLTDPAEGSPRVPVNDTTPAKTVAAAKKTPQLVPSAVPVKKAAAKKALPAKKATAKKIAAKKTRVIVKKAAPTAVGSAPERPAVRPSTRKPKAVAPLKSAAQTAHDKKAGIPPSQATKLKDKLVRDSFTMPQTDFALIAVLKDRALGFRRPTKKSELLRAGLQVLNILTAEELSKVLNALSPLKAGRPKKKVDSPQ